MRHESDPSSVAQVVSDLREEPFDPVLLYKAQGTEDADYPNIPTDGFVLAIQTKFQKELYEKFGHSVLCIDATHGTNAYNFMLITCIVPDEFERGINMYMYIIKSVYMYGCMYCYKVVNMCRICAKSILRIAW